MLTGHTAPRPRALVDKGDPQVPRKRRLLVFVLAALAGAAVVVMPALAGTEGTPAVEAFNGAGPYGEQSHEWRPPSVTIAPGGAITISNPTNVAHGVEWRGGPEAPSCGGTIPVGSSPASSGTQWSGTCTFAKAGVYVFYCTVHGRSMTGQVTVGTPETPTTTQPPPTQPPGTGTTPSGSTQTGTSTTPVASAPLLERLRAEARERAARAFGAWLAESPRGSGRAESSRSICSPHARSSRAAAVGRSPRWAGQCAPPCPPGWSRSRSP